MPPFNGSPSPQPTTPAPYITLITPPTASVGSTITISGQNLNGFEGYTDVKFTNQNGQEGVIEVDSHVPQGATTLNVNIPASLCSVSLGMKGGPCPSYLSITPGTYQVSVFPWGLMSNSLSVTIQ